MDVCHLEKPGKLLSKLLMCSNTGENNKVRCVCVRSFLKSVYKYIEQCIRRTKPSRGVINDLDVETRVFCLETLLFWF